MWFQIAQNVARLIVKLAPSIGEYIRDNFDKHRGKKYGLKITDYPKEVGSEGFVEISGTYKIEPPKDSICLITTLDGRGFYPQVGIEHETVAQPHGKWSGKIYIKHRGKTKVLVTTIGPFARRLFDYYEEVGRYNDDLINKHPDLNNEGFISFHPIRPLPIDVYEHDSKVIGSNW